MRRGYPWLVALAAAAALIGGCGGGDDEKQRYADDLEAVMVPLGDDLEQVSASVQESENADDLAVAIQSAEDQFQAAIDDLEQLDPPAGLEDANDALIAALAEFSGKLSEFSNAAASGDKAQILSTATELPAAVQRFQSEIADVRTQLEDEGIEVSG